MKQQGRGKGRGILFLISLLLIAGVGAFLAYYIHGMQVRQNELNAQIEAEAKAQAEAEAKAKAEEQAKAQEEAIAAAKAQAEAEAKAAEEKAAAEAAERAKAEEEAKAAAAAAEAKKNGISVRGDCFDVDGADKTIGYPSKLQQILEENGYKMTVQDNTWDMAGSLSQMALAGVSQDIIDGYIAGNPDKIAALGYELSPTETVVRDDLSEFYNENRDDLDYIPVICIGFFGGWGCDPYELAEQQQAILQTYNQQDKFVILGVYPNINEITDSFDTAYYDQVMADTWGEHYLQLSHIIDVTLYSEEGHQQMAQALYDKLSELGYLGDAQPAEDGSAEQAPAEGENTEEAPAEEAPAEEVPAEEAPAEEAPAAGEEVYTEEVYTEGATE